MKFLKMLSVFVVLVLSLCWCSNAQALDDTTSKSIVKFLYLHRIEVTDQDVQEATSKPIDGNEISVTLQRLLSSKDSNDLVIRVEQQSLLNLPANTMVDLDGTYVILRDGNKDSLLFWTPETNSISRYSFDDANGLYHKSSGNAYILVPRGYYLDKE